MQSGPCSKQVPMVQRDIVYMDVHAMHQHFCLFGLLLQDVQLMTVELFKFRKYIRFCEKGWYNYIPMSSRILYYSGLTSSNI